MSEIETSGVKQVTAAVTVKVDKLIKLVKEHIEPLQKAFDDATSEREAALATLGTEIDKFIGEQAEEIVENFAAKVETGYGRPGESVSISLSVPRTTEFTSVPAEPNRVELDTALHDLRILEIIEDETMNIQPGSNTFGKYVK